MRTVKSPYDRFRESNTTSFQPATHRVYRAGAITTSTINGPKIGVYRNMYDHVTPAFREMSAAGLLINNPVSSKKCTFSGVSQTGWGHQNPNANPAVDEWKGDFSYMLTWWQGALGNTEPSPLCDASGLITAAVTKAMANVNKPVVQGLAFLGELQDTIDLLRHPFAALTKFFRKPLAKQRIYGKVTSGGNRHGYGYTTAWQINRNAAIGAIASQYLAFQFGVKPLMHDIEGIVEALVFRHPEVLRQTARGKMVDSRSSFTTGYATTGFVEAGMRTDIDEELTVRAGVLYAFKGESATSALGVRLSDIPSAAWELLPWSFVIDWFVNVGDVVAGLTAMCTNDLLTQWITISRRQVVTRRITSSRTTSPWVETIHCGDSDRCIYETYSRTPMSPGSGMGFAMNLSLNRTPVLSAISLLVQQLTGNRQNVHYH